MSQGVELLHCLPKTAWPPTFVFLRPLGLRLSRKAFNGAEFRGFRKTQKSVDFAFDHSLSHNCEKFNKYPGVAQLGARVVWDHQAAGSIPVTRTKFADLSAYESRKVGILCGFLATMEDHNDK